VMGSEFGCTSRVEISCSIFIKVSLRITHFYSVAVLFGRLGGFRRKDLEPCDMFILRQCLLIGFVRRSGIMILVLTR
jgi:hypothetical protein